MIFRLSARMSSSILFLWKGGNETPSIYRIIITFLAVRTFSFQSYTKGWKKKSSAKDSHFRIGRLRQFEWKKIGPEKDVKIELRIETRSSGAFSFNTNRVVIMKLNMTQNFVSILKHIRIFNYTILVDSDDKLDDCNME